MGGTRAGWVALLVGFGLDNLGSGLFLPLTVVYVTEVVGLPVGRAGLAVTVGTLAGLAVPALAASLADRVGSRRLVVGAQLTQALGAGGYLLARDTGTVVLAAVLVAAGQQLFYSSLFSLVAGVAGDGPKDRTFTVLSMVRDSSFAVGGLVAAVLLSVVGRDGYRWGIAADVVSFVVAAGVVACAPVVRAGGVIPRRPVDPVRLWRDRPYLALIAVAALLAVGGEFFLLGIPVYTLAVLHTPAWLPGVMLTVLTLLTSTCGTLALRLTAGWSRIVALRRAAVVTVGWCLLGVSAAPLSPPWPAVVLLLGMVPFAASRLLVLTRINALAEASAPPAARGRYLAAFQYAFTVAGVLTPAVVAAFSVAVWLPWAIVAAAAAAAALGFHLLGPRLSLPASVTGVADGPVTGR